MFSAALNDPKAIDAMPTNEKYSDDFLEVEYIVLGDEIKEYFPEEMYDAIVDSLEKDKYHREHEEILKKIYPEGFKKEASDEFTHKQLIKKRSK
jgi:hypothetical protein